MTVKPIGFAVCLLLLAGAASPSGKKQTANPSDPEKSVGDGSDAIRQRIRLYLERHGDGGRIDPERRLKAVAADYALRRAEAAQRRVGPQGVVGSNWISLGPTNGAGRMTAIAPHPTIAGTLYVGAADGGVWKTTDGGSTWTPMTDDLSDLSVGALVLAPSSPSIIYLGSGEGGYNADFIPGIGLLKSSDGGVTWTLPAAVVASEFYRLSVHPTNPLEIVAGTNQGGLRSTDGGETWTNVISRATYGDVVDMVRHSSAPSTLYAATWCIKDCSAGVGKILIHRWRRHMGRKECRTSEDHGTPGRAPVLLVPSSGANRARHQSVESARPLRGHRRVQRWLSHIWQFLPLSNLQDDRWRGVLGTDGALQKLPGRAGLVRQYDRRLAK